MCDERQREERDKESRDPERDIYGSCEKVAERRSPAMFGYKTGWKSCA